MASPVLSLQPVSEGAKQRFLERGQAEDLPANIRRCWERVRSAVDPTHEAKPHVLEGGEVRDRADRLDRWLPLLPEALESVHRALSRRDHVVLFADRDAVVLHQSARAAISDAAREAGIVTGSVWDEGVKGTNAIGTALVEGQPMTVHGAAHFSRAFHNFTCYAALVHDLGGDRLGVIDATTIADRRAPDGWRAVATAAAQWERKMRTLAGPEDHLLRWSQLERIVGRFRGTTAVFGPRGTLRLGLDGEPRHGSQRDLAALWVPIERAIRDGQVSLQSAELELHLEPFHDPSGRLLEIIVHSERRPPQRSFHGAQRLPAADPLTALEGADPAQRAACHRARRLASTSLPIALLAETGTGKELLARAIHRCSPQREGPFVALNCAALPEGIVESELFGHAPGAFTGAALRGQEGWLAAADGGTLFLDEVADLPAHVQLT
ncbi:MAG: sigma 54-interacting transcriptional regulator, partial [Myxococcota bacterium]